MAPLAAAFLALHALSDLPRRLISPATLAGRQPDASSASRLLTHQGQVEVNPAAARESSRYLFVSAGHLEGVGNKARGGVSRLTRRAIPHIYAGVVNKPWASFEVFGFSSTSDL